MVDVLADVRLFIPVEGGFPVSQSSNPVVRTFAAAGAFLALGAIVVAASQGGASATTADQKERVAKIESVHATTANPTVLAGRSPQAIFQLALPASMSDAAQPGNEPAAVKLAKQTCDALPTWGAQQQRMTTEVSELMGRTVTAEELRGWAKAASLGFCPGQFANAAR
jgi:hypothetical protein